MIQGFGFDSNQFHCFFKNANHDLWLRKKTIEECLRVCLLRLYVTSALIQFQFCLKVRRGLIGFKLWTLVSVRLIYRQLTAAPGISALLFLLFLKGYHQMKSEAGITQMPFLDCCGSQGCFGNHICPTINVVV